VTVDKRISSGLTVFVLASPLLSISAAWFDRSRPVWQPLPADEMYVVLMHMRLYRW
jgi:hypothetical protein